MFNDILRNRTFRNIVKMLLFGLLSLVLGEIKFHIPGFEGTATDLREVAVFLSVLYLPHWIYLVGVSIITAITTPADGSVISTIITHIFGSVAAYFFYHHLIKRTANHIYKGLVWAAMIVANYFLILLPTLVLTSVMAGLIAIHDMYNSYLAILAIVKYEIFTTTAITSLFVVSFEMRNNLKENNLALLQAKNKAEESDKLKTSFLENISHEIRTPLNAIVGFSNVLVGKNLQESKANMCRNVIVENSNYLLSLINQIIDFAKIESKLSHLTFTWRTVDNIISDISNKVELEHDELVKRRITFSIKKDDKLNNLSLKTEQFFLLQIILNLIMNSIKFTSNGTILLELEKTSERALKVTVRDTGIGISKHHLNRIFDRFYQVDSFQRGVGLSLTLSKRMVDLLDGHIWVDSEIKKGAVFSVEVPVEYKEAEASIIASQDELQLFNRLEEEILIAEDEEANYQYLKAVLDQYGIHSKHASNGEEAITIFKKHKQKIGLILMDIKMPKMDGISATKAIRNFPSRIPVIMQSAYDMNNEVSEAYRVGCTDFLTKPISRNRLIATINKYSHPKIA